MSSMIDILRYGANGKEEEEEDRNTSTIDILRGAVNNQNANSGTNNNRTTAPWLSNTEKGNTPGSITRNWLDRRGVTAPAKTTTSTGNTTTQAKPETSPKAPVTTETTQTTPVQTTTTTTTVEDRQARYENPGFMGYYEANRAEGDDEVTAFLQSLMPAFTDWLFEDGPGDLERKADEERGERAAELYNAVVVAGTPLSTKGESGKSILEDLDERATTLNDMATELIQIDTEYLRSPSDELANRYNALVASYNQAYSEYSALYAQHESQLTAYMEAANAYNAYVEQWGDRILMPGNTEASPYFLELDAIENEISRLENRNRELSTEVRYIDRARQSSVYSFAATSSSYEDGAQEEIAENNRQIEILNARRDELVAQGGYLADDDYLGQIGYGGERTAAAVLGFGENLTDFFGEALYGATEFVTSLGGFAPNAVSEWAGDAFDSFAGDSITAYVEESIRERYNPTPSQESTTGFMQTVTQVVLPMMIGYGIGNLSSAVSAAPAGTLGAVNTANVANAATRVAFGANAGGSAVREAHAAGASHSESLAFGFASAAMELAIEEVSGTIPGLPDGSKISNVVNRVVSNPSVQRILSNPLVNRTLGAFGEGLEESASAYFTPYLQRATYASAAPLATGEEIWEQGLMGGLASLCIGAGIDVPVYISEYIAERRIPATVAFDAETIQAVIDTGLESPADSASYRLATDIKKKQEAGKEITAREITELHNENVKQVNAENAAETAVDPLEEAAREAVGSVADDYAAAQENAVETPQNEQQPIPYNLMPMNSEQRQQAVQQEARRLATEGNRLAVESWTGYGERGVETFTDIVEKTGHDPGLVRMEFQNPYEMGLTDAKVDESGMNIVQLSAYKAGQLDRLANIQRTNQKAQNTFIWDEGLDTSTIPAEMGLTKTEIDAAKLLFRAFGVKGGIGQTVGNASIKGGVVTVASDFGISDAALKKLGSMDHLAKVAKLAKTRGRSLTSVLAHEIAMHRAMELAPTESRAFMDAMYRNAGKDSPVSLGTLAQQKQEQYGKQGVSLTADKAIEEIVADLIVGKDGLYKTDEEFVAAIRKIVEGKDVQAKKGAKTWLDSIKAFLRRLGERIGVLKGEQKAQMQQVYDDVNHIKELFETAMKAATDRVTAARELQASGAPLTDTDVRTGGENLGIKDGEVSMSDIRDLFGRLNSNERLAALAEKVFATAERLGVNIRFTSQMLEPKNALNQGVNVGLSIGDMVEYHSGFFNYDGATNQVKAQVLVHELIHTCSYYAMVNGYQAKGLKNAAKQMESILREIRNDPAFKGQYGLENALELVAELSNEDFVNLLKTKKSVWDKIVDWFCNLFGIQHDSNAYEHLRRSLETMLSRPDIATYREYAFRNRQAGEKMGKDVFGSTQFSLKDSGITMTQDEYLGLHDVQYNLKAVPDHKESIKKNYASASATMSRDALMERYEKTVDMWKRLSGELNSKFLEDWNNKTDRVFTIFKAQSGYKYNVELSSMCKKGVPLFEAIDTIVKQEVMREANLDKLGKAEKEILYDILKQHGFEIPCAICYVEQARQREGVIIDAFLNGSTEDGKSKLGWNTVLNDIEAEMKANGVEYKFQNVSRSIATEKYTPADIAMDEKTLSAFHSAVQKLANEEIRRYNKEEGKNRRLLKDVTPEAVKDCFKGTLPSNLKIFKTLLTEPSSRFRIGKDLLYSSMTTMNLAALHNGLYGLFNAQGGVSGYKTKQGTTIYWGELLGKRWSPDTVRREGGIRQQSNSDFQMFTFLDKAQMYIDHSAKGFYVQEYSKVLAELKLFGLSGAKLNASLIPAVVEYKNADGSVDVERTMLTAGLDENGNPIYDDFEGINHAEAFMLLEDPNYSRNVCGICIGYSDMHIEKLLNDPRVQMIIGFHDKTNDPNKRYRGARYAKNYNGLNEAVADNGAGKTVHIGFNPYLQKAEKLFTRSDITKRFEGTATFGGKQYVANDIPRLAADMYLADCAKKGYRPAYNDFIGHPNYYKLLSDIGLYDSLGQYALHEKVAYKLPDRVPYLDKSGNKRMMATEEYIKAELQKELAVRDSIAAALADTSENGIIPQFKAAVAQANAGKVVNETGRAESSSGTIDYSMKEDDNSEQNAGAQRGRGEDLKAGGGRVLSSVRMLSGGAKPVHSWSEAGLIVPKPGSVAANEAAVVVDEYGLPVFVVRDNIYDKHHSTAPAFAAGGQVFLRETLPENGRGDIGVHEVGHAMKQMGFAPYISFLPRVKNMMNSSELATVLKEEVAKACGVNLKSCTADQELRVYDEICNMVMGAHHAERHLALDVVQEVFGDFDGFVAELTNIHEQFKHRNDKQFSLKDDGDLIAENARLKEANQILREQFKTTKLAKVDKKALNSFTRQLLKDWQSGAEIDEVRNALDELYTYIANGEDGMAPSWEDAYKRAYDTAVNIIEQSSVLDDQMYQDYKALRDRLRTVGISISPDLGTSLPGYESLQEFRQRNFGRIKLRSDGLPVDMLYSELATTYPEFFDESEYSNPADQLVHLAEVLDELQPVEVNPYSQDMRESATWLANDIMERFFDLPQAKPTFADKAERKLTEQAIKDANKLERVREQKNERIRELIERGRDKVKKVQANERIKRAEAVQKVKEHYKAKEARASEGRKESILREKIVRHVDQMSKKLLKGTDRSHIPEGLRGAVAELLSCINLESNRTYDPDTGAYRKNDDGLPTRRTEEFRKIKEQYEAIAANNEIGMVMDPNLLGVPTEGIKSMLDQVIAMQDIRLVDMSLNQLQTVYDVLRTMEHSITTAGKTFTRMRWSDIHEMADSFMEDTATRKSKRALTERHYTLDIETPYTFFYHMGESGHAFYRMLRNAQDSEQVMQDELVERMQDVVSLEARQKAEKETVEFTTQRGDKLTLSKAHIMEIYLLNNRPQARNHLLGGGIVQPKVGKIRKGTEAVLLTETDVAEIISSLTAAEREMADGLQKITLRLAEWGNEASMTVYGYKKFNDPNYWTIRSSEIGINQTVEQGQNKPRSIGNMGSAKNVIPEASNTLDIGGVFNTFDQHASDMLCYSAWLAPMEDANRLFNYKFRDENWNPTGKTMKGIIERVAGDGGTKYWLRLMEDIQNGLSAPVDTATEGIVMNVIGKTKRASIAANLRVVIQQPTAIGRSAAVLDPDLIIAALGKGVAVKPFLDGWNKAVKYAPIAARKAAGGFEIASNSKQLSEILYQPESKIGKVKAAYSESGMWLAGKADEVTWGTIWNACELQVKRDNKGLKYDSDEFYAAVKELFTEVVDQTQVVDGVLQRSQAMRSGSAFVKQMTAFTGEPTMSANMVIRAYDQVRYETDPKKRRKAIKKLGRSVAAYGFTAVLNAFAQSLVDAYRDDDDEKDYWEKVWKHFIGISGDESTWWDYVRNVALAGNISNNLNPLTWLPVWKDVLSVIQGYSVARMDAATFEDFFSATANTIKSVSGDGKLTPGNAALRMLLLAGKLGGSGGYNLLRDIEGAVRTFQVETENYRAIYDTEKLLTQPANNRSKYMDILFNAYQNDQEAYEYILSDMLEGDYFKSDKATTEEYIMSAMDDRLKESQGVKKVSELDQRYMLPAQQKTYDSKMSELKGSGLWSNATEEQRDKVEANLYGIVTESEGSEEMRAKISEGKAYDLDDTEYLLYKLALDMYDTPNEKGDYGTYTSREKADALLNLGLGDSEIAYLWGTDQSVDAYEAGVDMEDFVEFKSIIGDLKSDRDANGKEIKGRTRKDKIEAWLRTNVDDYKDRLWLAATEFVSYKNSNDYQKYFGK